MKIIDFTFFADSVRLFHGNGAYTDVWFEENTGKILTRIKNWTISNVQHTGIYLGTCSHTGEELVMHNHLFEGGGRPHISTFEEYAGGQDVYLKSGNCINDIHTILDIALTHILEGRPYMPLTYNCQIFSSTACNSKPVSEDAAKWLTGFAVVAGVGLFGKLLFGQS